MSDLDAPPDAAFDADVIVVGSGFGGAVTALRLTEAGHRVLVLEKGRRLSDEDLLRARRDPRAYLWQPEVGLRGFFWQRIFRHVAIIGASGVGGGSTVWAGVLLEPRDGFYADPAWSHLRPDWRAELRPHLDRAAGMLGRVVTPHRGPMDDHLRAAAERVGAGATYGPVPVAIHFGREGVTEPDPFFGGEGPDRTGCRLCGECLLGCPYGARNQLTRNYLHLAEKYGAEVRAEHEVTSVRPLPGGGYEVAVAHPWRRTALAPLRARRVVLAGGVLGTLDLLFRCRDELGTLPHVSPMLGTRVRTNSEALTAILQPAGEDLSRGPTISSDFYPDPDTHVTQNRFVGGWHMRLQVGPIVDGARKGPRALRTLGRLAAAPVAQVRRMAARGFERRLTVLTVMQHLDNELAFERRRSPVRPWRRVLRSRAVPGRQAPSYLPVANEVPRLRRVLGRHAAEPARRDARRALGHRARPRRRRDGGVGGRGRGRHLPRGLRPPGSVRRRCQHDPGQPRGEPLAHHHRAGRAVRRAVPGSPPGRRTPRPRDRRPGVEGCVER